MGAVGLEVDIVLVESPLSAVTTTVSHGLRKQRAVAVKVVKKLL